MADKIEWLNKLKNLAEFKGLQSKAETGHSMRLSLSDGSLVSDWRISLCFPPLVLTCVITWREWKDGVLTCHFPLNSLKKSILYHP